ASRVAAPSTASAAPAAIQVRGWRYQRRLRAAGGAAGGDIGGGAAGDVGGAETATGGPAGEATGGTSSASAPSATGSSGCSSTVGAIPSWAWSCRATIGSRDEPPTRNSPATWSDRSPQRWMTA